MRGLRDKVSVVVGAAPGNIGAGAAARLAAEGAQVVVADLAAEAAEQVAEELCVAGGRAVARTVDISSAESVSELFTFVGAELGGLDCLFNVAADLSARTMGVDSRNDVVSLPLEVWQRTLEVNLTGYMLAARSAIPMMVARGGGSIVNTMSAAAWLAQQQRPAYGTSKVALEGLTRHVAAAYGKQGVRCNAVAPGLVLTVSALRVIPPESRERQLAELPSPRLGTPEDVGALVAFLCSDDGAWINGQTIRVDGGRVMR